MDERSIDFTAALMVDADCHLVDGEQKVVIRLLKGLGEVSFAAMVVGKLFRWNLPMSPVKCCSR